MREPHAPRRHREPGAGGGAPHSHHGAREHAGHEHGSHEHLGPEHAGHAHTGNETRPHTPLSDAELRQQRPELPRQAGAGKVLYFDAFSGAAGDMCVAALVDLGVPFSVIERAVGALGIPGLHLGVYATGAGAIGALGFDVHVHGTQPQRCYAEIKELLQRARLPGTAPIEPGAVELAERIFARLAQAEARVHRVSVDDVHFHEVGAVDSLADIVGVAAALDYLGAAGLVCSRLPMGRGFVTCQHGPIPIPAPATVLCLEGLWTTDADIPFELVTPTAAAVLGEVATPGGWPQMRVWRTGWGAGKRTLPDRPNALRVVLGELGAEAQTEAAGTHRIVETNLDDASGELLGHAVDVLLRAGALDAWVTPCTMKKGRPGWVLAALSSAERADSIAEVMLRETPAIGVRFSPCARRELPRVLQSIATRFGEVRVKRSGEGMQGLAHAKPEFDHCRALAAAHGVPVREVWEAALAALNRQP